MDACSSRGHPTRRFLLHGTRSALVRRRVGLRSTTGLVGKAPRLRFVLACLSWSLCGRPARRRYSLEDNRRWLALDGRAVVPRRRRPLNWPLRPDPQDLSYFFFALLLLFLTLGRRRHTWLVADPRPPARLGQRTRELFIGPRGTRLELIWSYMPPVRGRLAVYAPLPGKVAALTLGCSFVATLVNPHGPALISYAVKVSTSSQLAAFIAEWQSPNFHSYLYLGVIIGPVLLLIGLVAFSTTVFALDDVVLACLLFLAALHAIRFAPYFALAACAMLAPWSPIKTETIRPSVLTLPLSGVLAVALLLSPHVSASATAVGGASGAPRGGHQLPRKPKRQGVHHLLVGRLPHLPAYPGIRRRSN